MNKDMSFSYLHLLKLYQTTLRVSQNATRSIAKPHPAACKDGHYRVASHCSGPFGHNNKKINSSPLQSTLR
jgi:hypothetical protein